jgi:hypothetical protein
MDRIYIINKNLPFSRNDESPTRNENPYQFYSGKIACRGLKA